MGRSQAKKAFSVDYTTHWRAMNKETERTGQKNCGYFKKTILGRFDIGKQSIQSLRNRKNSPLSLDGQEIYILGGGGHD